MPNIASPCQSLILARSYPAVTGATFVLYQIFSKLGGFQGFLSGVSASRDFEAESFSIIK